MKEIEKDVDILTEALRKSEVYAKYTEKLNALKAEPDLKRKVDDYRKEIYDIQNSVGEVDDQRIENVLSRYAEILELPIVGDFLDAEVDLCKMIQLVLDRIVNSVELD